MCCRLSGIGRPEGGERHEVSSSTRRPGGLSPLGEASDIDWLKLVGSGGVLLELTQPVLVVLVLL